MAGRFGHERKQHQTGAGASPSPGNPAGIPDGALCFRGGADPGSGGLPGFPAGAAISPCYATMFAGMRRRRQMRTLITLVAAAGALALGAAAVTGFERHDAVPRMSGAVVAADRDAAPVDVDVELVIAVDISY